MRDVEPLVIADHQLDLGGPAASIMRSHSARLRHRFFAEDVLARRRGEEHMLAMEGRPGGT